MNIYCGSAKVDITPTESKLLAGYMATRQSKGIHDPIYARIVAIRSQQTFIILVSLDLICIDQNYTVELRKKISDQTNVSKECIFLHATHTHSGPGGTIQETSPIWRAFPDLWMPYDRILVNEQHKKIVEAVKLALENLEECKVSICEGEVSGIAANRISSEIEYSSILKVIEFEYCRTNKKIIVYHFACHPTIMNRDNLLISADFPGVTSSNLENENNVEIALFINGPSGDISTRFTRKEASFYEVRRVGTVLSAAVLELLIHKKQIKVDTISSKIEKVDLALRNIEDSAQLQHKLHELKQRHKIQKVTAGNNCAYLRKIESEIEGVSALIKKSGALENSLTISTEIQVLKLGEILFVSIPGEIFNETGTEITNNYNGVPVFIAGNTNDYIGYIVPEGYYASDSYEAYMTLLEKGSSEKIRDTILYMMDQL
ncbi:hypothetical protein CHH55_23810 [Niallia circulans]|uniref:neutral/alkaline non-lysosomal ceramidase N-terminal domain-containing protein n=1 Tax=Niallia TaxID=2837506 RepID=UPI000BA55358|nr:neutral/alkaline non-lysosomal ceramidase N-terminal domain-containing protein [Niallia circulans]PAD23226.1 hypothetical protein CHH62_23545 [Niallia circulans]PAD85388.1 hypothetical protein CHH55_23810 [Niallia circulans]